MKKPNGIRSVSLPAPAKINLFLAVFGIRNDGFHEIFSVLAKLELHDMISIEAIPQENHLIFECVGNKQLNGVDNLVEQAVHVWREHTNVTQGFRIILDKRIPIEAGLGGGSSDAVAALIGLNSFLQDPLSFDALHSLSLMLGSDCPSFLISGLCLAKGRGEEVSLIDGVVSDDLKEKEVLLFKPPIGFSTPEIYSQLARSGAYSRSDQSLELFFEWSKGRVSTEDFLFNDLQEAVFLKHLYFAPLFKEINSEFGLKSLLTGSGSCCFCLGKKGICWEDVKRVIQKAWGEDTFLLQTRFEANPKQSNLFS